VSYLCAVGEQRTQIVIHAVVKWKEEKSYHEPTLQSKCGLEQVPEELVVNLVMELNFLRLDDGAEGSRAAIGGGALQFSVTGFDVGAEKRGGPLSFLEVFDGGVDVVRQVPLRGTQ